MGLRVVQARDPDHREEVEVLGLQGPEGAGVMGAEEVGVGSLVQVG